MSSFIFATGIENSYPTIGNGVRVDQMEQCGHYRHWLLDLELVRECAIRHLRWGPALYRTFVSPGTYDWSWTDEVLAAMRGRGIEPLLDLCHFGLPDWLGNFQNPEFPHYFAEYAGAFAKRHPWVRFWTPVNEILIAALFSAQYGWWNERLSSDQAFVRATSNLCRASIMAMDAIRDHVADPVFVQCESCEFSHPDSPPAVDLARFHNERRFLGLDLVYGRPVTETMHEYLMSSGMSASEYEFFLQTRRTDGCVIGTDYYALNEHIVFSDGNTRSAGERLGYYAIARQYYDRYRLPLMHTETNLVDCDAAALEWMAKQWHAVLSLVSDGVPIMGFTWYSLTDQIDWDTALRVKEGRVHPVGLFDLNRRFRQAGKAYCSLIGNWRPSVSGWTPTRVAA